MSPMMVRNRLGFSGCHSREFRFGFEGQKYYDYHDTMMEQRKGLAENFNDVEVDETVRPDYQ
jgi:hypothetical protein